MNAYILSLFFISCNGLKLLTNENFLEQDEEVWESNIKFTAVPFKGKCTIKTDGTGPHGLVVMPDSDMASSACAATTGISAAEVAEFCTSVGAGDLNYDTLLAKLKTDYASIPGGPIGYAEKVAKLLSMAAITTTANTALAFDIEIADGTLVMYKTKAALSGIIADAATHLCYHAAAITWAKNDPIVKNMNGEEFEIMATGIFSLLTVKETEATLFQAAATIDRAGTRCGATYIQNMTLSGKWVDDIAVEQGFSQIQIRADAAVPKTKALQVNFNGDWQTTASHLAFGVVKHANANKINLKINRLDVVVSVDAHRIHEEGKRTGRFANFLNVNFGNMAAVSGFSVGGLLGNDSHEAAVELPEGCDSPHLIATENFPQMFSRCELS